MFFFDQIYYNKIYNRSPTNNQFGVHSADQRLFKVIQKHVDEVFESAVEDPKFPINWADVTGISFFGWALKIF